MDRWLKSLEPPAEPEVVERKSSTLDLRSRSDFNGVKITKN